LSSATCFVTYRRLPAYKKPNGGGSNLPPMQPSSGATTLLPSPNLPPPPARTLDSSRPLSRPPSAQLCPASQARGACETPACRMHDPLPPPSRRQHPATAARQRPRDRITSLSVLTAKTRNWGTM
ncbi:hypothetical protein WN51_06377, partial [Melipona quadrifasciata]